MGESNKGKLLFALGLIGVSLFLVAKFTANKPVKVEAKRELIRVGGFSKDIERLQRNINNFARKDLLEITGAYSNKMKEVILEVFKDTDYLLDVENGGLDVLKIKELNLVLENINKLNK